MSDSPNVPSSGIGFFGFLGIAFIVLKLMHYIDWSWAWVLAPLWGPVAMWLVIMIVVGAFYYTVKGLFAFAGLFRKEK